MQVYDFNKHKASKERKAEQKLAQIPKYLEEQSRLKNVQKSIQKIDKLLTELTRNKEKRQ